MTRARAAALGRAAEKLLARLASGPGATSRAGVSASTQVSAAAALIAADLALRRADGALELTPAGRAFAARRALIGGPGIDPFVGQHLALARRAIDGPNGRAQALVDDSESPLAWLARRKGRDGRAMIEPQQLEAGERLRLDFTRAQLMPRVSSNWSAPVSHGARAAAGGQAANITDVIVAARQRVRHALDAVGPEFAGLLVDVCCFLKGLEDVERERLWPPRSAKVVLQLALDRLARHYGLAAAARGKAHTPIRTWLAADAAFAAEDF